MTQNYAFADQAPQSNSKNRNRCVLMGLGAVEVALGSFCVIMGGLIVGHEASHFSCFIYGLYNNKPLENETTIGEGIWCGVWTIVAGGLGIAAGKKKSSSTIIKVHMAFAIIGALFAGALVCVSCAMVSSADQSKPFYMGIVSTIAIAAFASMVLQIVSASYCSCADKDGGCGSCCDQDQRGEAISHVNTFQVEGYSSPGQSFYVSLPGQLLNNQVFLARSSQLLYQS